MWASDGNCGGRRHRREHVRNILNKLNLPETADDHRRVRAVITFLSTREQF